MKKYLRLLPLLAVLALAAGCGKPDHRRTVVHHQRHVHRTTALVLYYDPNVGLYYGHDASSSTWYTYSIPAPLHDDASTTVGTQAAPVTVVASAPSAQAPAAVPVGMSAPGASWGTSAASTQANPSAVSAVDNAMADKAAMTGNLQSIPAGGNWAKSEPPNENELVAEEGQVSITTNGQGEPETEEAVEAENTADSQAEAAESAETASDSTSDSAADSSSSDGGGGDGGGGD